MSVEDTPHQDPTATLAEDYPALTVLHDAWLGSGRKAPEAVRAYIELRALRGSVLSVAPPAPTERKCYFHDEDYCSAGCAVVASEAPTEQL